MEISFIGAGKASLSLAKYFKTNNKKIKYIYDLDRTKAMFFAEELGCEAKEIKELIDNSEIVFLTVNDSAIYPLWDSLREFPIKNETIFIHCSGAKSGIYGEYNLYSLHPAAPLTGEGDLEKICFGLEEFGEKREFIKEFIEKMGNRVFYIPKDKKSEYHLANVIVSNLSLSLFERGISYLSACGLSESEALALLMPLAKQNLLNIESKGITPSVTGPASRGDYDICKGHLEVINKEDREIYINLSQNILKILGKNPDEFPIDKIEYIK